MAFLLHAGQKAVPNFLLNLEQKGDIMLTTSQRLRKSSEISAVMRSGKRFSAKLVVLHVAQGTSEQSKVAFAVGKNVGNSVVRHRITRQLRHIVAPAITRFPIGSHIVVRALPGSGSAHFNQLNENFEFALTKVPSL